MPMNMKVLGLNAYWGFELLKGPPQVHVTYRDETANGAKCGQETSVDTVQHQPQYEIVSPEMKAHYEHILW